MVAGRSHNARSADLHRKGQRDKDLLGRTGMDILLAPSAAHGRVEQLMS
jgi:hypothetical protein